MRVCVCELWLAALRGGGRDGGGVPQGYLYSPFALELDWFQPSPPLPAPCHAVTRRDARRGKLITDVKFPKEKEKGRKGEGMKYFQFSFPSYGS